MSALALLFGLTGVCALTPTDVVRLSDHALRLKDLATLDCLADPQAAQLSEVRIAELPRRSDRASLSRRALVALIRRRIPGLPLAEEDLDGEILFEAPQESTDGESAPCYAAARAIAARALVRSTDLASAPCPTAEANAYLSYDRTHRVLRARADIEAGQLLGRVALPGPNALDAGEPVTLRVAVGAVVVERSFETAQPSTADRVFVRDDAGRVVSIPASIASDDAP